MICAVSLYILTTQAHKEPIKTHKPVEVENPATPKPPPPGETAENGHWHGDEWHAEPHGAHPPAEVSEQPQPTTEAQSTPVGAQQVNAQSPAPMQDSSRTRTPQEEAEIQRQWKVWREWENQYSELGDERLQLEHEYTELLAQTEDERFKTDENFQRELGRKRGEVFEKIAQVDEKMKALEKTKPPVPPSLR
jgi:hypothetical protein